MTQRITTPSPVSAISVGSGSMSPEWFRFFVALLAAVQALDERVKALENAP